MGGMTVSSTTIRGWLHDKKILASPIDESKVQPSSFEPTLSKDIFILDTDNGLFRPRENEDVYTTLLRMPKRQRQYVQNSSGFELKKGFSYLIRLNETLSLDENVLIKSSPKSSLGRLFINTRLLCDFNASYDEAVCRQEDSSLWLLVQPLAFNVIVHEGLSLNQLRFSYGNSLLYAEDLQKELKKHPLLFAVNHAEKDPAKKYVPCPKQQGSTLYIHLDISGQNASGIIGLRAKHNPMPIDLQHVQHYPAEDFFEPIKGEKGSFLLKKGEYYLMVSKEYMKIPSHLNVELKSYSHLGFHGPLHFAGFIDNGFEGDLVFEVRSDEQSHMLLQDGMPISALDVYRCEEPDKIYGKSIGSNYFSQMGPRVSKYFTPFDYKTAAKHYARKESIVLVQDRQKVEALRRTAEGFEPVKTQKQEKHIINTFQQGFFHSRYDCETDERVLQPIPYLLLFTKDGKIFSYARSKKGGDKRLFGRRSFGVGGHVEEQDLPDAIHSCLKRELQEEVAVSISKKPILVGTLADKSSAVSRVHFGLIYAALIDGPVTAKEDTMGEFSYDHISSFQTVSAVELENYEGWSQFLVPYLDLIFERLTSSSQGARTEQKTVTKSTSKRRKRK